MTVNPSGEMDVKIINIQDSSSFNGEDEYLILTVSAPIEGETGEKLFTVKVFTHEKAQAFNESGSEALQSLKKLVRTAIEEGLGSDYATFEMDEQGELHLGSSTSDFTPYYDSDDEIKQLADDVAKLFHGRVSVASSPLTVIEDYERAPSPSAGTASKQQEALDAFHAIDLPHEFNVEEFISKIQEAVDAADLDRVENDFHILLKNQPQETLSQVKKRIAEEMDAYVCDLFEQVEKTYEDEKSKMVNQRLEKHEQYRRAPSHFDSSSFRPLFPDTIKDPKLIDTWNSLIGHIQQKTVEKDEFVEMHMTAVEFKHLFVALYGEEMLDNVSKRYGLDLSKGTVDLHDIAKVYVGIAAHVSQVELRRLFAAVKNDQVTEPLNNLAALALSKEELKSIQAKERFNDLEASDIALLLSAFRGIPWESEGQIVLKPTYSIINQEFIDEIEKQKKEEENFHYQNASYMSQAYQNLPGIPQPSAFDLFMHDLNFIQKIENYRNLNFSDERLRELPVEEAMDVILDEYVGKDIAYFEYPVGTIIPLPSENKQTRYYEIKPSVDDRGTSIVTHFLAPLNGRQALRNDLSHEIFFVFRGTAPTPSDQNFAACWIANLHNEGIGKKDFHLQKDDYINCLDSYLKQIPDRSVKLHITGHSLGGCLTQRALAATLQTIAFQIPGTAKPTSRDIDQHPLLKLNALVCTTHNAPRPEEETNMEVAQAFQSIRRADHALDVSLTHMRFFDQKREDIVEQLGLGPLVGHYDPSSLDELTSVFTKKENSQTTFSRKLIEVHLQDDFGIGGTLTRHGAKAFCPKLEKELEAAEIKIYKDDGQSNETLKDLSARMGAILQEKEKGTFGSFDEKSERDWVLWGLLPQMGGVMHGGLRVGLQGSKGAIQLIFGQRSMEGRTYHPEVSLSNEAVQSAYALAESGWNSLIGGGKSVLKWWS